MVPWDSISIWFGDAIHQTWHAGWHPPAIVIFPAKKTTPSTSKCETMKPSSYWEPPWTWTVGFPGSPALGPRADGDASKVAGWMVACDSPNIPKVWGFHIGNLTHHQNLLIQGRVLDQEWRTLYSSNANGGIMGKHVGKHQMISTKGRLQVVWKQHVHQPQQQQSIPETQGASVLDVSNSLIKAISKSGSQTGSS